MLLEKPREVLKILKPKAESNFTQRLFRVLDQEQCFLKLHQIYVLDRRQSCLLFYYSVEIILVIATGLGHILNTE